MSPTIGLPPPGAERCLDTSRKSRYRGGTLVAEDVRDVGEHLCRLAEPDRYRPACCPRCSHDRLHVHSRPERRPRGEVSLPSSMRILQFRCANEACGATWRILPLFLARHLWHAWKAVERVALPTRSALVPSTAVRTRDRWRARLASSARVMVAMLAATLGEVLEEIAKRVGLLGTRAELVAVYAAVAAPCPGERLSSLAAVVHRVERGIRLM